MRASSEKRYGTVIVDGQDIGETTMCCHCGVHFKRQPGSGKVRGYCMNCRHVHCGGPNCCTCNPIEKRHDLLAMGKIAHLLDDTTKF